MRRCAVFCAQAEKAAQLGESEPGMCAAARGVLPEMIRRIYPPTGTAWTLLHWPTC